MRAGAFFDHDGPISWPIITGADMADSVPPDPDESVVPEEVEALIRRIEDQASRLRNAAEVHFMRKRIPGYRNRSYRRHTWPGLMRTIWETPVEYPSRDLVSITDFISSPPWYKRLLGRIFG